MVDLQHKLQLPQLEMVFRLGEHTRSLGEHMPAHKHYHEGPMGHVQLVLESCYIAGCCAQVISPFQQA